MEFTPSCSKEHYCPVVIKGYTPTVNCLFFSILENVEWLCWAWIWEKTVLGYNVTQNLFTPKGQTFQRGWMGGTGMQNKCGNPCPNEHRYEFHKNALIRGNNDEVAKQRSISFGASSREADLTKQFPWQIVRQSHQQNCNRLIIAQGTIRKYPWFMVCYQCLPFMIKNCHTWINVGTNQWITQLQLSVSGGRQINRVVVSYRTNKTCGEV